MLYKSKLILCISLIFWATVSAQTFDVANVLTIKGEKCNDEGQAGDVKFVNVLLTGQDFDFNSLNKDSAVTVIGNFTLKSGDDVQSFTEVPMYKYDQNDRMKRYIGGDSRHKWDTHVYHKASVYFWVRFWAIGVADIMYGYHVLSDHAKTCTSAEVVVNALELIAAVQIFSSDIQNESHTMSLVVKLAFCIIFALCTEVSGGPDVTYKTRGNWKAQMKKCWSAGSGYDHQVFRMPAHNEYGNLYHILRNIDTVKVYGKFEMTTGSTMPVIFSELNLSNYTTGSLKMGRFKLYSAERRLEGVTDAIQDDFILIRLIIFAHGEVLLSNYASAESFLATSCASVTSHIYSLEINI